jgi:hypothetical protein
MNSLNSHAFDIAVLGRGEAEGSARDSYRERVKSIVRYADPAAWATVDAVGQARACVEDMSAVDIERTGVLLVSEYGPVETMATVASTARDGYLSAFRFPAATPGSLVGLTCIVFGFRGPTLNLTMPPAQGVPIAAEVARNWLKRDVVNFVFIATCQQGALARCLLVARRERLQGDSGVDLPYALSWLLTGNGTAQIAQEEV